MASLSKSTRTSFRRRSKPWLDEGAASAELVHCNRPEDVEPFLDGVDRVYADTWQARTYGFRARNTQDEIDRLKRLARRGWLRSYLLWYDGEPVAFQIGYQYKGVYYDTQPGYTQTHARLGAGTALYNLMVRDLYEQDTPEVIDLGQGTSNVKVELRAEASLRHPVHLTCGAGSNLLIRIQCRLDRIESVIRALLERWQLDRRVRRILKRRAR